MAFYSCIFTFLAYRQILLIIAFTIFAIDTLATLIILATRTLTARRFGDEFTIFITTHHFADAIIFIDTGVLILNTRTTACLLLITTHCIAILGKFPFSTDAFFDFGKCMNI